MMLFVFLRHCFMRYLHGLGKVDRNARLVPNGSSHELACRNLIIFGYPLSFLSSALVFLRVSFVI